MYHRLILFFKLASTQDESELFPPLYAHVSMIQKTLFILCFMLVCFSPANNTQIAADSMQNEQVLAQQAEFCIINT